MATARVLVIDDEALMREYVVEALERAGYAVQAAETGQAGILAATRESFDVVVSDLKMTPVDGLEVVRSIRSESPDTQVIIMTAYGTVETAIAALKAGACDYIMKPFSPDELELVVDRAIENQRLKQENRYLRAELDQRFGFGAMVGDSMPMGKIYDQIRLVAASRATVLIRGESGTGKELVARAIHSAGPRKEKPFIKVNCAALSAGLLESELFGHEKGSFTGAHERKIGRFELADQGTLLLDEISEMSLELQPKLLRALQEREFERVGGAKPIQADVRIVCTSNRNLEEAVEKGQFREDLFYRINVIPIHLPPLRERAEDVPALLEYFLNRYTSENGRDISGFSEDAIQMLKEYPWPGNVRELQNSVERAVVLSTDRILDSRHFPLGVAPAPKPQANGLVLKVGTKVAEMERQLIMATLEQCQDNRTHAAKILGISVRTLRNKLKEYFG
ncbi:MAG: sigma-54-dependent Fis family transcriptional regulator [Candidatus Hydrogenedentota bacterium]